MPQGSVLVLFTSKPFSILEIKLISYADDSTLMAVVLSPGVRVPVGESLIRDLVRVSEWCQSKWTEGSMRSANSNNN